MVFKPIEALVMAKPFRFELILVVYTLHNPFFD